MYLYKCIMYKIHKNIKLSDAELKISGYCNVAYPNSST